MKRIPGTLFFIVLTALIPLSATLGQEKNSKEKIKVVIADDEGIKTVIDTVFTDKSILDSIVLKSGKGGKHIIIASAGDADEFLEHADGKKMIIIKEGDEDRDEDADVSSDMTKYVIAKNGIVVTVESNDEAKAKDIINTVEARLDAKADTGEKKEMVKTEVKKSGKK
jgi:hypothetical protein